MTRHRFYRFAWAVLGYNLLVILWGAYVRATGSGAGCGGHWPTCNGAVVPASLATKTAIEFTHRMSVGVGVALVIAMVVWAFRVYPSGHAARKAALYSLFFTFTEALVGAGLVLYGLVEHNASVYRAVAMAAHLVNTFLLLGALALTPWYGMDRPRITLKGQGAVGWALGLGLCGAILLAVSGAVTALGDTLYPASSLAAGLRADMSSTASFLVRLRFLHPLIATSVGLLLLLVAALVNFLRPSEDVRRFVRGMGFLFLTQMGIGLFNMLLLAPVWMQLVHLLVADLVWINLILLSGAALSSGLPRIETLTGIHVPAPPGPTDAAGTATWKDYLALTKPRVISLLLFTTLAAMFIAAGGWPGGWLFLAVAVGGYMAAGSANAINMVIDRDIDGRMRRTANRPTVTQRIPSANALLFAFALEFGSFALLWSVANLLAAMLALAGLVFYVIVYTIVLKRRTWHNIVIGGAAGAFPPLVGWAAVTGELSWLAWCLFAIVFVWTPVHFWALALLIKDDYAEAGVPMLPCVLGERVTVIQIAFYAVLTAIISVLPMAAGQMGPIYLCSAALLNVVLILRSLQLYRQPGRPKAVSLYKYSMLYLALLFLTMAVSRAMHG